MLADDQQKGKIVRSSDSSEAPVTEIRIRTTVRDLCLSILEAFSQESAPTTTVYFSGLWKIMDFVIYSFSTQTESEDETQTDTVEDSCSGNASLGPPETSKQLLKTIVCFAGIIILLPTFIEFHSRKEFVDLSNMLFQKKAEQRHRKRLQKMAAKVDFNESLEKGKEILNEWDEATNRTVVHSMVKLVSKCCIVGNVISVVILPKYTVLPLFAGAIVLNLQNKWCQNTNVKIEMQSKKAEECAKLFLKQMNTIP